MRKREIRSFKRGGDGKPFNILPLYNFDSAEKKPAHLPGDENAKH
jgi:hypothetical protein